MATYISPRDSRRAVRAHRTWDLGLGPRRRTETTPVEDSNTTHPNGITVIIAFASGHGRYMPCSCHNNRCTRTGNCVRRGVTVNKFVTVLLLKRLCLCNGRFASEI
jgi:hypothetical protein